MGGCPPYQQAKIILVSVFLRHGSVSYTVKCSRRNRVFPIAQQALLYRACAAVPTSFRVAPSKNPCQFVRDAKFPLNRCA